MGQETGTSKKSGGCQQAKLRHVPELRNIEIETWKRWVGRGTHSARMRAVPTWVWIVRGEVPGSEVGIKVCSDQSCVRWVSGSLICFLCKDGRLPVSLGIISLNLVAYIDTRGLVLLYRAAIQRFISTFPFHNFLFLVTCDFGVNQKMPFAGVNSIYLLCFCSNFCGSLFDLWKERVWVCVAMHQFKWDPMC